MQKKKSNFEIFESTLYLKSVSMPLNWGSSSFSCNQNNHGSSGAYVTVSTASKCEYKTQINMPHGARRSWTNPAPVFACVVGKNPQTPKLSPMADDTITWGSIGGLGSLVYICGLSVRKPSCDH